MTRNPDVLERLAPLSGAPRFTFEDLLRLRAKRQLARKIGAIAVVTAMVIALVSVGLAIQDRSEKPAIQPDGSQGPTFEGMVIRYTGGQLVAQDPATGEVRDIVDPLTPGLPTTNGSVPTIYNAAISGDGRWAAFDVHEECGDAGPSLWVTNGVDEARRLTKPCVEASDTGLGLWGWSPAGDQLLVVLGGPDAQQLILMDPASGGRTELGHMAGEVTAFAWSPDATRVAYATGGSPTRSIYTVSVDGGEHALIAHSIGAVPGGEEGAGLAWSPDGTRIAVLAEHNGFSTLYVMNTDGADRRTLAEGVNVEHGMGSPNIIWSPDGTRIAYATDSPEGGQFRIWSVALDGSDPVQVFDSGTHHAKGLGGGPVWSPDSTRIAFRYDPTISFGEHRWLVANADGSGDVHEIDELQPLSWRPSLYFCECYG